MAIVWGFLLNIYDSPGAILILHQCIYWSAVCIFAFSIATSVLTRTVIIVILGLWPPLAIHSIHVWKDVGMMSGFALAASTLIADLKRPHLGWLLTSFLALFYAASLRHNAILPAFPLMCLFAYQLARRFSSPHTILLSSLVLILVLGLFYTFMSVVNKGIKTTPQIGTVFVWDLAAISLKSNELVLPNYIQASVSPPEVMESLRKSFNPNVNVPTFNTVSPYITNVSNATFVRDWLSIVFRHPKDYFYHRLHVFSTLIGINEGPIYYPFHEGIDPNDLGITFSNLSPKYLEAANTAFRRLSKAYIYRPWLYLVLGTGAFLMSSFYLLARVRARREASHHAATVVATLSLSGLASVVPLFVFAPAADYRYNIWLIMSVMMILLVLIIRPQLGPCDPNGQTSGSLNFKV
jgi:hypothetical protein